MLRQTYAEDGRTPIQDLYRQYLKLESEFGWKKDVVYEAEDTPVYAFLSPIKGPALWVNSGVHGEEPPGPIAIGRNIEGIGMLGGKIPMVVIPLLNPIGYSKGWRYFNEYRDWHKGTSVSGSDHYLPDLTDSTKPRSDKPSSDISAKVTKFAVDHMADYPPVLTVDHHEDEALPESYIYSQGPKGVEDLVAKKVVEIMQAIVPLQMDGITRFGEKVKNGIVADENGQPVKDGSIDELYTSPTIYVDGQWIDKPSSKTSLVIETPTIGVPLEKRIEAHQAIINNYEQLFNLANE